MRIVSGSLKGRKIIAPNNLPVRPTTDMAKESLFNILNNQYYFEDLNALDLFSGTGNIAYELGSRGTKKITCVEMNANCVGFIKETTQKFDLTEVITIIKSEVCKYLNQKNNNQYNLIFADPPYDFGLEKYLEIINLIFEHQWLSVDGSFVLEHSVAVKFDSHPKYTQIKRYGSVCFSFFN